MITTIAWIVLIAYLLVGAGRHAFWAVAAQLLSESDTSRFHTVVSLSFSAAVICSAILWAHS